MTEIDPRNVVRDNAVLAAMLALSKRHGYANVTRGQVAEASGLSAASVSNFGRTQITNGDHPRGDPIMPRLREAAMRRAVETGDLELIAQGLASRHPVALSAPEQLRIAALASAAA